MHTPAFAVTDVTYYDGKLYAVAGCKKRPIYTTTTTTTITHMVSYHARLYRPVLIQCGI